MEEAALGPLGFVATDYATLIWSLDPVTQPRDMLNPATMRDGLETWLAGNAVMKRTFKESATIAGLIERNLPTARKSGRQATFSSDILYDTLHKYDPDHVMMQITREEAKRGLVDFGRIEQMLSRVGQRIDLITLDRISPLSAPLFLEAGRVPVRGLAEERLMADEADRLMSAAGVPTTAPKRWAVPF